MILTLSSLYHSRNVHKYLPIMRGKKRVGVVLDRTKNGVLPYQINHIGGTNIYLLGRLCKLDQLVYNSQKDLEHCYFVNFIYFLPLIYWLIYQSLLNRLIKRQRFIIVRSLSKPLLQFRLFSEISPTCTLLTFLSCFIFFNSLGKFNLPFRSFWLHIYCEWYYICTTQSLTRLYPMLF